VRATGARPEVKVTADGKGVVSHAGAALVARVEDHRRSVGGHGPHPPAPVDAMEQESTAPHPKLSGDPGQPVPRAPAEAAAGSRKVPRRRAWPTYPGWWPPPATPRPLIGGPGNRDGILLGFAWARYAGARSPP